MARRPCHVRRRAPLGDEPLIAANVYLGARPISEALAQSPDIVITGRCTDSALVLGPLIHESAVAKYETAVRLGRKEGRIVHGGSRPKGDSVANGFFVEPAIIDHVPNTSRLFQEEYFAPVLTIAAVNSLEEAIGLANDSGDGDEKAGSAPAPG